GEWPPSPARLYQALMAGLMTCGYQRHAETVEPALRWLEVQKAPEIRACQTAETSVYRISVPNNDMDIPARDWARRRPADPARLRTMKTVQPRALPVDGPHLQYVWRLDGSESSHMVEVLRTAVHCLHTLGWGVDMAFADITDPKNLAVSYEPAAAGE